MALFAPCQNVSLSCFCSRGKNILWHYCQAVKYGLIVTPAITRRLVGGVCPIFFQPSDIVFRVAFVCIGSVGHAPTKESVYIQKKRKNRLLPCYQWLKGLLFVAFVVTKYKS